MDGPSVWIIEHLLIDKWVPTGYMFFTEKAVLYAIKCSMGNEREYRAARYQRIEEPDAKE